MESGWHLVPQNEVAEREEEKLFNQVFCLFFPTAMSKESFYLDTERLKPSVRFIWSPQARDSDAGINGQVNYRIVNHPDLFTIAANGSIYTKVPLDRELRSQYDVVVEALDGAVDPRRTTLTLSVMVMDIDDNSPMFTQETYVVSVPENSPVGTVVLKLSVSTFLMFSFLFFFHIQPWNTHTQERQSLPPLTC